MRLKGMETRTAKSHSENDRRRKTRSIRGLGGRVHGLRVSNLPLGSRDLQKARLDAGKASSLNSYSRRIRATRFLSVPKGETGVSIDLGRYFNRIRSDSKKEMGRGKELVLAEVKIRSS